MKITFEEMLSMSRPVSKKHMPMSRHDRAAQFSSFAALTGFDDSIKETNRQTGKFIELSEDEKAELDNVIACLMAEIYSSPTIEITYFVPDKLKDGGKYLTKIGKLKKIDAVHRIIILDKDDKISFDYIYSIKKHILE